MYYFSLSPHIYAAWYENAIIILDSKNDKYSSIIDDAASNLHFILDHQFIKDNEEKFIPRDTALVFVKDDLNEWINFFITNNMIVISDQRGTNIAPEPLKAGGLIEYRWDHKYSWKPFAKAPQLQVLKAFFVLRSVHKMIKNGGVQPLLDAITQVSEKQHDKKIPTQYEIAQLAQIIDAASLIYPTKTFCLAWATTYVLMALKKNWECNLAIGVQTNSFYAHAWAESLGNVIHDDPVIAQVLSVILREPLKK
jgi:hypothetical protein